MNVGSHCMCRNTVGQNRWLVSRPQMADLKGQTVWQTSKSSSGACGVTGEMFLFHVALQLLLVLSMGSPVLITESSECCKVALCLCSADMCALPTPDCLTQK